MPISEQGSATRASLVVFFLGGGHGLGGAPLAVVRSNVLWCRSLFSSFGAARQHMCEACEMGHCMVDGRTHRWPHVMKGDTSGCPLCDWTGAG